MSYIAQLSPGAVMNTGAGYGNFSSYGTPGTSNLFTLDGMDDNDPFLNLNNSGATNLLLGANEVQEATVVNGAYTGEYGTLAGAQVNYVTKSGGNNFHGNAVYFWNGSALNANDWFVPRRTARIKHSTMRTNGRDRFGGPIKKRQIVLLFQHRRTARDFADRRCGTRSDSAASRTTSWIQPTALWQPMGFPRRSRFISKPSTSGMGPKAHRMRRTSRPIADAAS